MKNKARHTLTTADVLHADPAKGEHGEVMEHVQKRDLIVFLSQCKHNLHSCNANKTKTRDHRNKLMFDKLCEREKDAAYRVNEIDQLRHVITPEYVEHLDAEERQEEECVRRG